MSDDERKGPERPRWVRALAGFVRGFIYVTWGLLVLLIVVALASGMWLVAALGIAVLVWRIAMRRLSAQNQAEVERWQGRADELR